MVVVVKKLRPWLEPVHLGMLRGEDMEKLYRVINKYQSKINEAFDIVSKRIGFVALTAIPVTIEVTEKGKISKMAMAAENMNGTMFEEELFKAMRPIFEETISAKPGSYELLLFWEPALRYILRGAVDEWRNLAVHPLVTEPAQMLHIRKDIIDVIKPNNEPGIGNVIIDAIDKVYTDLKLSESLGIITQPSTQSRSATINQ